MQNLFTIDLGNSHPHFGLFENGQLQNVSPLTNSERLQSRQYKIIASQVASSSFIEQVKAGVSERLIGLENYWNYSNNTFAKMPLGYEKSLGQDRLVQAAHAYHLYPDKKTMMIDAGTFATIDMINEDGHQGGYILPGLQLLLESYLAGDQLKKFTKQELIHEAILMGDHWPTSTKKAICAGVTKVYHSLYNQLLNEEYFDHIIVTGGDSDLHLQLLREDKRIEHRPHFIHESLYFLANFE